MTRRALSRIMPEGMQVSEEQYREFAWLAGGLAFTMALGLLSIKIVSTIGTAEYGIYFLALSVGGLLNLASYGPIETAFVRMYSSYSARDGSRAVYVETLKWILVRTSGVLAVVVGVGLVVSRYFFSFELSFAAATAAAILISGSAIPVNGLLGALRLRKGITILAAIERVLFIAFLILTRRMFMLDATMVLACLAISTGMVLMARLVILDNQTGPSLPVSGRPDGKTASELRREILVRIFEYSRPFILYGCIIWVQSNGERWVIDGVMTKGDVGRYGLAASLVGSSAGLLVGAVRQFIGPEVSRRLSSSAPDEVRKGKHIIVMNAMLTVIVFAAVGVALALWGDFIIHTISNRDFVLPGYVLVLLTFGLGTFHAGQAMTSMGHSVDRPDVYTTPMILAAVVSLALYFVGCVLWGIAGLATGLLVANLIYATLMWHANRNLERQLNSPVEASA